MRSAFFSLLMLAASMCGAQTYTAPLQINIPPADHLTGWQWSTYVSNVNLNVRYGYPLSGNWATATMTANRPYGFSVTGIANPQSEAPTIEFQIGTAAKITALDIYYCSAALSPSASIVLGADGTVTTQLQQPCAPATTVPAALVTPPPTVVPTPIPTPTPTPTPATGTVSIPTPTTCTVLVNEGTGVMTLSIGPAK